MVAKGVLEVANFPTEAKIGEKKPWDITVHNIGTDGIFGFGIANKAGNPGNMTVTWLGSDTTIPPGYYYRIYVQPAQPYCYRIVSNGSVAFSAPGNYNIDIYGLHRENTSWFIDDTRPFTVIITEPPPPPEIPPTLWERITEAWNNLEGYQKALIVATPIMGATVIIAKPYKKR